MTKIYTTRDRFEKAVKERVEYDTNTVDLYGFKTYIIKTLSKPNADILKESEKIAQKKSNLSRRERDFILYLSGRIALNKMERKK